MQQLPLFERPLTTKMIHLIELVAQGLPNKTIAYEMGLSVGTVRVYLYRLYHRIGCNNRTELAVMYTRNKL